MGQNILKLIYRKIMDQQSQIINNHYSKLLRLLLRLLQNWEKQCVDYVPIAHL